MVRFIKTALALTTAFALAISCTACGDKNNGDNSNDTITTYTNSEELLTLIWDSFEDDKKFPVGGGDDNHFNMEGPGEYSIDDGEVLDNVLGLPISLSDKLENSASLIHAMNQNTFTCAAYRFKDGTDIEKAVSQIKNNILARRWICGFPDSLVIITAPNNYIISVWGIDNGTGTVTAFKAAVKEAVNGAQVIVDEPIV